MAILVHVPDLKVEIVDCHRQPLNEYEDDENEQSQDAEKDQRTYEMTRYIESKSGAKFGVCFTSGEVFDTEYGILMEVRIDGYVAKKIILADLHEHGGQYVCSYKHEYRNAKCYRRDFQFADLEVGEMSEDDIPPTPCGNIGVIGTISIVLYNIENVHQRPVTSPIRDSLRHKRIERVTEKSMKGDTRSHSFTLGERRKARPRRGTWLYNHVDEERLPFAKYHFKYRSLAALKSLYVIPRSPSPVRLEERPEDNMSPDELRDLVRQLKNRQGLTVTVKREQDHDDSHDAQPSTNRRGVYSNVGHSVDEAIDLTRED